ncbi:MAG: class I SAM-dependent methyltransferase [Stomatobaculum sp.]|nr:class I SAM-dependent methyltransferase [Stomatobaculum sp.]
MKKKKDASLEYMLKLGIFPAKTPSGALEQLKEVMDPETLKEVLTSEETGEDPQAFYRVKNRTLETALTVSGAFGGDVLRKACGLIDASPDLFQPAGDAAEGAPGEEAAEGAPVKNQQVRVAEAGCDCGIVSCFIAQRFPETEVTGFDLCAEGISAAEKLSERLGLSNTCFVTGSPETLPPASFDVVFSLRTMHENCDVEEPEIPTGEENDGDSRIKEYEEACFEALCPYAAGLAALLKPGGSLLSVERGSGGTADALGSGGTTDALGSAWRRALERAGLAERKEARRELLCTEVGKETRLQVCVMKKSVIN